MSSVLPYPRHDLFCIIYPIYNRSRPSELLNLSYRSYPSYLSHQANSSHRSGYGSKLGTPIIRWSILNIYLNRPVPIYQHVDIYVILSIPICHKHPAGCGVLSVFDRSQSRASNSHSVFAPLEIHLLPVSFGWILKI